MRCSEKNSSIPSRASTIARRALSADAFDALTNRRSYHAANSVDHAFAEIVACSGTQFAPSVVEALLRLHRADALPLPPTQGEKRAA